jgi:hypothetical protein
MRQWPRQAKSSRKPASRQHCTTKLTFRMSAAGGMALAGWRGIAMGPVVDCNICRNFGNIGDYYVYNRVLLE